MARMGALLAGGLLVLQAAGGTGVSRAVDRINAASTAPLPTVLPREVTRPDAVWVPDRYITSPGSSTPVLVGSHWERRVSDRESYVPPLSIVDPVDGTVRVVPAGVRPRVEERSGP